MEKNNNVKKVWVYNHNKSDWEKYTHQEMDECFNFVTRPNYDKIEDIHLHNVGFENKWLEVTFKDNSTKIYNNVFGTYAEQ